jgi:uncharacterized protein YegP (UPF0339 family)
LPLDLPSFQEVLNNDIKRELFLRVSGLWEKSKEQPRGRDYARANACSWNCQDPIFEIQCNAPDKFRFHLKVANGQIIAVSQSYLTRQSAEKDTASMKKNTSMAKVVDHTKART